MQRKEGQRILMLLDKPKLPSTRRLLASRHCRLHRLCVLAANDMS